jgi:hypothetical protein
MAAANTPSTMFRRDPVAYKPAVAPPFADKAALGCEHGQKPLAVKVSGDDHWRG